MQRQPFINWLLLKKKKKVLERLLWEFHLLSLCRRPLELLRGEELHWSCSKKVNAKPTTRTRATGFTLHQKTLPLTLRNCRTHPSGISNVKYTQRNHSAAETDGLLTLRSVRTDRTREKKKKTLSKPFAPLQGDASRRTSLFECTHGGRAARLRAVSHRALTAASPAKAGIFWGLPSCRRVAPSHPSTTPWVHGSSFELFLSTALLTCRFHPRSLLGLLRVLGFLVSRAHEAACTACWLFSEQTLGCGTVTSKGISEKPPTKPEFPL